MALRHAWRTLRRSPGFTVAAILTLALGSAAATAMFAVVHGVLLAPLPYGEPERLVSVRLAAPGSAGIAQPPALQATYARHARSLDGVAFYRTGSANVWTPDGDGNADSVLATWVSASTMSLLRVRPLLGREFTAEEELRGGPDAVILGEAEWRSRFGASRDAIGRTLMVNSVAREIVGVMPAGFSFPPQAGQVRVWLPAKRTGDGTVGEFSYAGVARLAPGADAAQAQRELATLLPRMAADFPRTESGSPTATWLADTRPTPVVVPLHDELTRDVAQVLWMLAVAAGLVLLVAWANVANLLLVRADGRQPELAVRSALGASRLRTATHFIGESAVLGAAAAVLATILASLVVAALATFGPTDVPRLAQLRVGMPMFAFAALVAIAGVLVCAAVPAIRAWHASPSRDLREAGRSGSTGRTRLRARALLATLQIAVALVVTVGSALLLRTAHGLHRVDPGFDATHVTTLRTQLPFARYDEAAAVAFYARLVAQARTLPEVHSAGLAMRVPLARGPSLAQEFRVEGGQGAHALPVTVVDDGYFAALSIPLVAGRGFREIDRERGTDIVISRRAAATLFGDVDANAAIGRHLALASGLSYTVVGVVDDVRDRDLATAPAPLVYRALAVARDPLVEPAAPRNMAIVVRSDASADALVPALRRVVRELDPTVAVYGVEAMGDVLRASTARLTLVLACMAAAAALTLVLGSIGLYGLMAYMVALRRRELAVRAAMGAGPSRIASLVATRGIAVAASGIAIGLVACALLAPLLRSLLFGVRATDPATIAAATLLLVATSGAASWIPALRAARVDPAESLRGD
ncbi:MAG TPA: ADOP family duplicated permease [Xanthomonadales bacterium]|nr:ADOP family duplicated permease [Xanthomonadales bacterium]